MRLLIVEDDDRAARYLVRGLSESGHVVDHAGDGETGLALASEGIYDALIVDRRLPQMDGLTLVRRLRERDTITLVLMLSATATSTDRVEGMRAGCDDYLAKPYAFAEVLALLYERASFLFVGRWGTWDRHRRRPARPSCTKEFSSTSAHNSQPSSKRYAI